LAYIAADSAGLVIYDLATPAAPRRLGGYYTKGKASGIDLSGTLAFLACGDKGLQVIDIRNPTVPVRIGSFEQSGYALKVAVAGSYAYVQGDKLSILDVRDPSKPIAVGSFAVNGIGLDMAGHYAYVASYELGLRIIDIGNPAEPRCVGIYDTPGRAQGVRVAGNFAYVADQPGWDGQNQRPGGLEVIDISNPAQPRQADSIQVTANGRANDAVIAGTHAFVAEGPSGMQIIDISDPASPRRVGGLNMNSSAQAVTVSGQHAYVAAADGTLQVIDISAPGNPKLLGMVEMGGFSEDVAVSGRHAFLAEGAAGLRIIDVNDPARPILSGVYGSNVRHVAADGLFVYLAADSLQVLEVSDPIQPKRIASLEEWANDVFPSGDFAYLSGSWFRTVDVREPARPTVVGSALLWELGQTPRGMAFVGPYACLGQEWDGMQVLDLSTPNHPRQIGSYYSDAPVWDVATRGDVACVTLGIELPALEVLDISDLQRPTRTARVPLPLANNVAFMGSYACVTGDGLQVFDIGDPYRPVLVGSHKLGSQTRGLQVIGDLVYVAAGEYGLAIYRLLPPLKLNPPAMDGNGLRLSWPGAPGIRLQSSTSLSDRDWQDVPNSEGASSLQLFSTNDAAFFRLVKP
jgi:hypothetical protein